MTDAELRKRLRAINDGKAPNAIIQLIKEYADAQETPARINAQIDIVREISLLDGRIEELNDLLDARNNGVATMDYVAMRVPQLRRANLALQDKAGML